MKQTRIISGVLLSAGFFLFACQSETKTPDSEKVANEANDAKIETNTFEKDAEALVKLSSQDQYLEHAADYAVKNAKWEKKVVPDHDLNIIFTRGLAGSTDYHLGGFRAVPDSLFKVQYTRPLMLGTRCHMLGMYIVLESALQMLCDYPAAYENQPGFSTLRDIPTTWDETRVIDAKAGKFACVARRKGSDWYIGAINSNESREFNIPLQLFGENQWEAEMYSDPANASSQPDLIVMNKRDAKSIDILKIRMAAGGGALILLRKK